MSHTSHERKPWKALRPGIAAARCPAEAMYTIVVFDVSCDKARRKLGEMCLDYGLVRFQWSAFDGEMTRNRREELFDRASELLSQAEGGGKLLITPVAARERSNAMRLGRSESTLEKKAV